MVQKIYVYGEQLDLIDGNYSGIGCIWYIIFILTEYSARHDDSPTVVCRSRFYLPSSFPEYMNTVNGWLRFLSVILKIGTSQTCSISTISTSPLPTGRYLILSNNYSEERKPAKKGLTCIRKMNNSHAVIDSQKTSNKKSEVYSQTKPMKQSTPNTIDPLS